LTAIRLSLPCSAGVRFLPGLKAGASSEEPGELLVDQADELLAVWDGQPARGFGGTADVVAYAHRQGVPVRIIWPEGATRG
ncbi:hypothetical protein ABT124_25810, partial [Streptomyces sp. NPDC001982]